MIDALNIGGQTELLVPISQFLVALVLYIHTLRSFIGRVYFPGPWFWAWPCTLLWLMGHRPGLEVGLLSWAWVFEFMHRHERHMLWWTTAPQNETWSEGSPSHLADGRGGNKSFLLNSPEILWLFMYIAKVGWYTGSSAGKSTRGSKPRLEDRKEDPESWWWPNWDLGDTWSGWEDEGEEGW